MSKFLAGGAGGAAVGTFILPGLGTIVGGLVGSVVGGVGVAASLGSVINQVGDAYNYDVVQTDCDGCHVVLKARKYKGEEPKSTCDGCVVERKEYWKLMKFRAFASHDIFCN